MCQVPVPVALGGAGDGSDTGGGQPRARENFWDNWEEEEEEEEEEE